MSGIYPNQLYNSEFYHSSTESIIEAIGNHKLDSLSIWGPNPCVYPYPTTLTMAQPNNILITGGAGYIGSRLINHIYNFCSSYNVVSLDNYVYGQENPKNTKAIHYDGDIRDTKLVKNIISRHNINIIIHLAAYVGMNKCNASPRECFSVNLEATQNLVKLAGYNIRFIFPNTNSGYGVGGEEICTEESKIQPLSLYAQSKFQAEQAVLTHVNSVVFRLATVFGDSPRMRMDLLVNDLVWKAYLNSKYPGDKYELKIFQPNARRNYVHISDVCEGLLWAIQYGGKQQVYNLGNDSINMTKLDLIRLIKEYIDFDYVIDETTEDPDKRDYYVSSEKLKNAGFIAEFGLRPGIIELTNKYKNMNEHFPKWYKNA